MGLTCTREQFKEGADYIKNKIHPKKFANMTPLKILTKTLSPGRAGLLASEAGPQGCGSLLVGGGAREEPQEEQAHPPQPKRHAGKGKSFTSLPFQSFCVQQPSSSSFCFLLCQPLH